MITYKEWDEISYAHAHEWMDDACAHEMQVPNACLTLGCYTVVVESWRHSSPRRQVKPLLTTSQVKDVIY